MKRGCMAGISRRGFLQMSAAAAVGAHSRVTFAQSPEERLLFVGTQTAETSRGIYAYKFNSTTGKLTQVGLAAETDNPTFLAISPDGKTLFAANELGEYAGKKSGALSSFSIDRKAAKLAKINEVSTGGAGTCHVNVDHTGQCVFVANYDGGSAASFAVDKTGKLSNAVSFFQYSGRGPKEQQDGPKGHRVTPSPDNRFLLVNDLGLDKIHIYQLDVTTARLKANDPSEWKALPGSGPRALVFHPSHKWAYCVNEVSSSVNVLNWNAPKGELTTIQSISTVPDGHKGPSAPSEIVMDKAGRFVYVANRLDDFMVSFSISPRDGRLTLMERTSCGGKVPRHVALDPSERWLLVANQATDNLSVFARDRKTGKLANEGKHFPLSRPQCIVFV